MRTLVLNAGYEPVRLVNWQKAICLVVASKAEVITEYDQVIRSVSQVFKLPSVVRLKNYARSFQRVVPARCTRKNILLRDSYQCQYCGIQCTPQAATIDHIIPKARQGKTTWENVVTACNPCNRRKGSKAIDRTGMKLLRQPRKPSWIELFADFQTEERKCWEAFLGETSPRKRVREAS